MLILWQSIGSKMKVKYRLNKREVTELLREKGINPTAQRVEIAHLMYQKPQHLSADEILQILNSEYEQVSQATVYNTLKLFVEKNVVRELIIASDRIYYDSNTVSHHHFVDVETGQIFDIPLCIVPIPELSRLNMGNAQVFEASVILRGKFGQITKYDEVQSILAKTVLTNSETNQCSLDSNQPSQQEPNEAIENTARTISQRRPLKSVASVS